MILLYLTVNGSQLRIVCNHGYVHSLNMSYNLELLSPPSPSHRQWRTGRVCTVRSVTGGRWESASTRCCSGRHHSTPSLSWRPMARSCNTRCSIFCIRSLLIKFCGDDWCRKVPATCVRGTFCYSTSQEAGRLMDFVIWSVVGSHSDSSDSCTLFSLDSPRHAGHMQGVLLHSLALVFTGYLQDMSAVLPSNPSTLACTPPLGCTIHVAWQCMLYGWCSPSVLRQRPFGLILCMLLYTWKFWRPLNLAIWREIAWINIWWI